jgi:hypothetical protein
MLVLMMLLLGQAGDAPGRATFGPVPFPDVTIPGVPDKGDCCLARVHKTSVDGSRTVKFGTAYVCKVGDKVHKTARGPATLRIPLVPGSKTCDELPKVIPDGSLLEAKGVLTRRLDDGFSHFIGTFTIKKGATVLFKGTIETIDNISTHHKPFGTDPCDKRHHLQGWLVGAGVTPATARYTLRALLEANIDAGAGNTEAIAPFGLNGVLIECH